MVNKKPNYTFVNIKILLVILIISFVLIPLVLGNIRFNSNSIIYDPLLKTGDFSKDDYTAILTEEKHGLGNISINYIDFNELETGFSIYNETYPKIWEDYNSKALNMTPIDMQFVETMEPAIVENLKENIQDRNVITVKINESLFVEYKNLTRGYLIYHARLYPCNLLQFFVDNNTEVFELINETDYIIDENEFIVFNYDNYFQKGFPFNFSMYFIWEYDITIESWDLAQYFDPNLIMNEIQQNFTVKYSYNFTLIGKKLGSTILRRNVYADNIDLALTVNLPDKNSLNDHTLELNNEIVNIITHLNPDKSIDIFLTDNFDANQSKFSANFTSSFTLEFIDPVGETWAIDRHVAMRNIRERIYFPSLINGPKHIYLKYISFNEPTIYFDQNIINYSLFERKIAFFKVNTSLTGEEGINVRIPYLIVGETCPFIIKYETTQNLHVVITDNIKMPLVGASVEVFYYGKKFGTYISNDRIQPIHPGITNEHGVIKLNNVPYGNYTIRVYYNAKFIIESTVNTYNEINYIYTNVPHVPLWILIFGISNGSILIIGMAFYLKYKKKR